MTLVVCEVHQGLTNADASVAVKDVRGFEAFLHVERAFLTHENGHTLLPIGVVHRDRDKNVALIELPEEAGSGAHRLWVPLDALHESLGTPS
jgi:hypothetical protein